MAEDQETLHETIRGAHMSYLCQIEPFHGELHRYARGLTGCVFQAEDLCQEAIVRTFVRLGQGGDQPNNLRAYLFRVMTHVWYDECRRRSPEALPEPDSAPVEEAAQGSVEVGEAIEQLVTAPPRARAAVLLKDVFDFTLAEIAEALSASVGAVKAALHRGRSHLKERKPIAEVPPASRVDPDLVRELVDAFNGRDVEGLLALMVPDAEVDLLGVFRSRRQQDRRLVVSKTLQDPQLVRAELREYRGEPIVLLWHRQESGKDSVGEILRIETTGVEAGRAESREAESGGSRVLRSRWYYFCPDTIRKVARDLGVECQTHGFHGVN